MANWCAICTSTVDLRIADLDGIPHTVCGACDEEPARAYSATRGYEVRESSLGCDETLKRSAAALKQRDPLYGKHFGRVNITAVPHTPTYLIERIPRRDSDGRPRDQRAAFAELRRGLPGVYEFNFLGADKTHWLYERPDPALAKRLRRGDGDVAADLKRLAGRKT